MKEVNALDIRNHLRAILEELEKSKEPVLVSKGRRVRAALITVEDFKRRFLGRQVEERKAELLRQIERSKKPSTNKKTSMEILRELRGYPESGLFRHPMTSSLAEKASSFVAIGLSGCDACYAALADEMDCTWLTFDAKAHVLLKGNISVNLDQNLPSDWN